MLLHLKSILTPDQLQGAREMLARVKFVDGKASAGLAAARVKNNQEAERGAQDLARLDDLVMGDLVRHPVYRAGALPLKVAAPFYARYVPGMRYGDHVDDPIMGGAAGLYRTDIAITIFLNDPGDYDGGELVIHTAFGENKMKLPAGDAVMYPASSRHRVAEVTRGERLVAVTWVQSLVRDPARRELLYGLNLAREKLLADAPQAEETAQVNAAYVNLVRMWSEL
ncbi:MAG: Fe2+-dependent dioxygenase [Candidatus Muproteobacteria bacterium RBG_16_65_34]|uniref:Fe2+-dependent dioxygenase n=1 Tax=Candidatus Muproteobacteria bacterium RBG_16_65_34 TaxID=1817760 RepID=A0A1F6TKL0_9PROT|nr:MAG: Fe2+-dependent dioxygenase [Candidatus Muproteobacteria bacterium RBG_16_65_34]